MGTSHSFDGEIRISPPLNYPETKVARQVALGLLTLSSEKRYATEGNVYKDFSPLTVVEEVSAKDTEEGLLHVTKGTALAPSRYSDGGSPGRMKSLVENLVKALPGHEWVGEVTSVDECRCQALKIIVATTGGVTTVTEVKGRCAVQWENGDPPLFIDEL